MARTVKTPTTPKSAVSPATAAVKAKPRVKKVVNAVAAPAPKVNAHLAAGVNAAAYEGLSSFVNLDRRTKVRVLPAAAPDNLTDRQQKALYALRNCYGAKTFVSRGIDNGVIRDLAAMGLLNLSGGTDTTINGHPYKIDGEKPLAAIFTKEGLAYGKATAKSK
jgi:hypothetical protein